MDSLKKIIKVLTIIDIIIESDKIFSKKNHLAKIQLRI